MGLCHLKAPATAGDRPRQYFKRDFKDQAQRAERAGQQARYIVAGNVLHDLTTAIQNVALAIHQDDALHKVEQRADGLPRRP